MHTSCGLTIDCADPSKLAAFWADALGYEEAEPPDGYESWNAWFKDSGVPKKEWNDVAYLADPAGQGPTLSFLKVPEAKASKNRVHLDLKVGGGRHQPAKKRRSRIEKAVGRLTAAGARVQREVDQDGNLDHVIMTDPEGNEFCVV
jgi:catechol 2,3-dioxygenase-like lactoylglutathione lyase family enzyme